MKKKILIIVLMIIVLGASIGLSAYFYLNYYNDLKDKKYTEEDMEAKLIKEYEKAYDNAYENAYEKMAKEGQKDIADILSDIKNKMENGTTTLKLLRDMYPEYLVYNQVGGYKFMPILDVPMHNLKKENFVINEDKTIDYIEDGVKKSTKAIDVSKYQGEIDWEKVKKSGIDNAFIRVGIRGYGSGKIVLDEFYKKNIEGATKAGIKVGVYFFTQAITKEEAIEEADFVIENIKDYKISLPVVIDVEEIENDNGRSETLSQQELTSVVKAFMDRVKEKGYIPMLYGNIKCITSMIDYKILSEYDLWYAYYGEEVYIPYNLSGWQYSKTGKIDGIEGECDLNIFFKEWD